tara:strand:- start:4255 stop:4596 length:342 start_codon:yes stop_codon:yes gene_type:complete
MKDWFSANELFKKEGYLLDTQFQVTKNRIISQRLELIENLLCLYLESVQGWNIRKIKKYISSMKNVKVKGAEHLQRVSSQVGDKEYLYFDNECILVLNKYSQEVLFIGGWYHG